MKPVTREEQYLNRLTGEEQEIPEEPVTREEQYLARLCGQTNSIPDKPVTRREEYLANLCGEDVIIPEEQVTRMEQYMAFAAGARETKPEEPVTREEWYWDKYQGGDVPEEKTIAFTDIITVTDALARPAVDLQSEITATQNLNGYEYPWVGGAGTNRVDNKNFTHGLPSTSIGASQSTITASTCYAYYGFNINGGNYTVSAVSNDLDHYNAVLIYGYKNGVLTVYTFSYIADMADGHVTVDMGDCDYMRVCIGARLSSIEVPTDLTNYGTLKAEEGSTATPWENICPISGRTEVNVTRTGVNVWDEEWEVGDINRTTGENSYASTQIRSKNYIPVFPNTGYYIHVTKSGGSDVAILYYDRNKGFLSAQWGSNLVRTTPNNCYYIRFTSNSTYGGTYEGDISINNPSTDTDYHSYNGNTYSVDWTTEAGTVYGGTLDLTTGELTITHAIVDLGDLTWALETPNTFRVYINEKKPFTNYSYITTSYRTVNKYSIELVNGETTGLTTMTHGYTYTYVYIKDERATTAEEFTTLVTGQKMVFELATPQTISLTPTEVMMLENNNTIWADSGRVQLTYLSKAAERVQTMNASLQANALKLSGIKITKRTPTM